MVNIFGSSPADHTFAWTPKYIFLRVFYRTEPIL